MKNNEQNKLTFDNSNETGAQRRLKKWPFAAAVAIIAAGVATAFTFVNMKDFSKEDSLKLGKHESINIRSSSRIELIETDGDTIKIRMSGKATYTPGYELETDGKNLTISFNRSMLIGVSFSDLLLRVEIPRSYTGDLSIETSSGAISFDHYGSYDELNIKSSSGAIRIGNAYANEMNIKCTSGAISCESVTAGEFSAKCTSGRISIDYLKANEADIRCTSGAITISEIVNTDLTIESTSGSVSAAYSSFNNDIDIACSSGRVTLELPSGSQFELDARTSSGRIDCGFGLDYETNEKSKIIGSTQKGHQQHPNADNEITLRATSGGITIKEN